MRGKPLPWNNHQHSNGLPPRPIGQSIRRGLAARCPACGKGHLFNGYLRVNDNCPACGEDLSHHRADDAPPYFTILIVGHFLVGLVLTVEKLWAPPLWIQLSIWLPLTVIMSLALLRPIKGAIVGLQWALYMHGFDPNAKPEFPDGHDHHGIEA